MKTKCIVLGQENEPVKELKKIELIYWYDTDGSRLSRSEDEVGPSEWKNLELIARRKGLLDIIFGYDDKREMGIMYLGHWNDGIV